MPKCYSMIIPEDTYSDIKYIPVQILKTKFSTELESCTKQVLHFNLQRNAISFHLPLLSSFFWCLVVEGVVTT